MTKHLIQKKSTENILITNETEKIDSTENNPNNTNTIEVKDQNPIIKTDSKNSEVKDQNPIIKTDSRKSHDKIKDKNNKNSNKSNCKDCLCSVFNYWWNLLKD